jgi:plasmid replication initiation protein
MPKVQKKNNQGIVLIKKSNNLVESRYKFDIWETRFFLSILSNIQKENTDFKTYRIRYKDIIKTFGLKSGDAYASLRDAAKSLMRKTVRTSYSLNGVAREQERNLISTIDYLSEGQTGVENHEYIDVVVHEEMKPFLLQLSKNFTAYDLRNVAQLGVYSIRLYELLKQYESIGSRTLKVDEMKTMFELNTEYPKYNDFYRWVIKPSEAEINKHTDLSILEIEKLKEGRKVVALRFKFRAKTQQELTKLRGNPFQETLFDGLPAPQIIEISEEETEYVEVVEIDKKAAEEKIVMPKFLEETKIETTTTESTAQDKLIFELSPVVVTKFGVSFKVFMGLIEQYTEGEIRQAVQVTEKAVQIGKVENIAGFFVEAVRAKYSDPKQKKKQVETEQKAKIAEAKRVEVDTEKAVKSQKQLAYAQEMAIFAQLIQADESLIQVLTDKIRLGILGSFYKTDASFEENLKHPLLQAAFLSAVKEAKPDSFGVK